MSLLFDHWEHSPPAAEALVMIERMLSSYFGIDQRPNKAAPSKPAQVVDLESIPFIERGAPIPWMTAEEYLRRKKEGNGNPS